MSKQRLMHCSVLALWLWGCGSQVATQPALGTQSLTDNVGAAPWAARLLTSQDYFVSYRTVNSWGSGFQGEITLRYQGTSPIEGWRLSFEAPLTFDSVWNAQRLDTSGSRHLLGAADYNRRLNPGDVVVVGFTARGDQATPSAWHFETDSPASAANPPPTSSGAGLRAEFRRDSDWGSGFVGSFQVSNGGAQEISDWRLSMRLSGTLSRVWNAQILSQSGDLYTLGPVAHNRTLAAGQRTDFGFQASPSGTPQEVTVTAPQPTPTSPIPSPSPSASPAPTPPANSAAGYLHTSGSKILDSQNQEVVLKGLNWFGLETSNLAPHGLWSRSLDSMLDQMKSLGYNCIRLPFSNDVLRGQKQPNGIDFQLNPQLAGLSALQIMDKVVEGAGRRGMRVVLDRHRPDSSAQSPLWYSATCSEAQWIADWESLVRRYQNNPAVVAVDLHNEPHGSASWGDGNAATDWRLAAQRAGNRILQVNPNILVVVEGVERAGGTSYWWGGNLKGVRQHPVTLQVPGRVVYSTHDYATSVFRQNWFEAADYPRNLEGLWDDHWGYLLKENTAPVLVGEFGSTLQSQTDQIWLRSLVNYLKSRGASFTYWCWNPNSGDTGGILLDDWKTVDRRKQDLLAPLL